VHRYDDPFPRDGENGTRGPVSAGGYWPGPLEAVAGAFRLLVTGPQPLALHAGRLAAGLPDRLVPLDELTVLLLHPSVSTAARNTVWAELVRRARSGSAAWTVGLTGVALPGLRRATASLAAAYRGDPADLETEVLAGFLAALRALDPGELDRIPLASRLTWAAYRAGRALAYSDAAWAARRRDLDESCRAPARPSGHPDFVLAAAVRRGHPSLDGELREGGLRRVHGHPFANIYSDPDADHDQYGADIFPRHFIESLQPPSNYLGPERVFGLQSEDPDDDDIEPTPIVRPIEDYASWMPDNHKKDWIPPGLLPGSVSEAVSAFVLSCAARRARGQVNEHNSMLVHVTRFQDVQNRVADQLGEHLQLLRDRVRYGDENARVPVEEELRRLWERDFIPTTAWFPVGQAPILSWAQVWPQVRPAIEKIQVRVVNGTSKDALQYYEHRRDGLSVIAVGGNKLSRGLTLEGLSVSYYLRPSKMYDTLLQMGRWFGYRPGYEDLCRLFTTPALRDAYVEITAANDELRREFAEMALLDAKPEEFGLRVRTSSAGLVITAPNKMRRGLKVKLSYSGDLPETVAFDMREATLTHNLRVLEGFVSRLDETSQPTRDGGDRGSVVWQGVSPDDIVEGFLADYTPSKAHRVRPKFIIDYIRNCQRVDELGDWTVRLVSSKAGEPAKVGPHEVGLIERKPTNDPATEDRYRIRRILSPSDESTDLDGDQYLRALDATRKAAEGKRDKHGNPRKPPEVPTGPPLRRKRRTSQPLLLLYPLKNPLAGGQSEAPPVVGFAISFPFSGHATETEYVVNEIWQQLAFDEPDTDEDPGE
jgi:hypothetical protein